MGWKGRTGGKGRIEPPACALPSSLSCPSCLSCPLCSYGLSLLGVTILDYVVWRLVKNVIVCYRCQAVHRGYPANPDVKAFDLVTHDRHVYGAAPPGAEEGR